MKRDMIGYAMNRPKIYWPNGSKVAVNFVINYEEGAELTPVNGDRITETFSTELPFSIRAKGQRHFSVESLFEYGSRIGIWRLLKLFDAKKIPVTFFMTGLALSLNHALSEYLKKASHHEIAGHGWRWIDYHDIAKDIEKMHIHQCIDTIYSLTGKEIHGWYTGRKSLNTISLLSEIDTIQYHSESYADDLPYYAEKQLVIPYTLVCNDIKYLISPGFATGGQFYEMLQQTLDFLLKEDELSVMTIGLHPRISGHPGRAYAIQKFIQYLITLEDKIWPATRLEIAHYWQSQFECEQT